MKLLLTGDLHLGRASSRTGDPDVRAHRTVKAWERMVDLAIREGVRVVCLSGDIVDGQNKYWESVGPLEDGIKRLGDAGVLTVAVSGNHDHDVFPRLARSMPEDVFRLLGEGGEWTRTLVQDADGNAVLAIDGWSPPSPRVTEDPVARYALTRPGDLPVLGMVHGDLGVSASAYAPLSRAHLERAPVDAWLLGHIHVPTLYAESKWILYPGSPQAMDPGETGVHGPWLLDVDHGRLGQPRQIGLSSVRYEQPVIDVSAWDDPERDVVASLRLATGDLLKQGAGDVELNPEVLCLRPVFVGRTKLRAELTTRLQSLGEGHLRFEESGVQVMVDRWTDRALPEIDLQAWLDTHTVPGALARLIETELPEGLVRAVESHITDHLRGSQLPGVLEDMELAQLVRDTAMALLSEVTQ